MLRQLARVLVVVAAAAMGGAPVVAAPAPAAAAAARPITSVRIENLGPAQADVPFTFGQVFAPGDVAKGDRLAARSADGKLLRLQTDIKATHPDGSVRHAVVSGVLPRLAAGRTDTLALVKDGAASTPDTTGERPPSSLDASVSVTLDGATYRATLKDALAAGRPQTWLDGPIVREWRVAAPFKNAAGAAHPLLEARFAVRWYPDIEQQARVEVVVENMKTFQAGARNLDYDVQVEVGGRGVYARKGLRHYRHARWRQLAWWDAAHAPALDVRPDSAYLVASRALPNYDLDIKPDERTLADLAAQLKPEKTGPMTIGPVMGSMHASGGRGDIGPLPSWSVLYLLSGDQRARASMLAAAEGSGSWSIHLRDERTGYPLRVDTPANRDVSTHMNMAKRGPLPVPRCAGGNDRDQCGTPFAHDTAHQPSLAYLPYLLSGDYYYLEELQFWAASNPLATAPENSGRGLGLVRWQQVRGQAWSLRTLGHAAYITPDAHPLKGYFTKQLDNNLAFYHAAYVVKNPNRLGAYDASGANVPELERSAPWQDDFLTWSFGHLAELGFDKAVPILRWKARYAVGRMTAPGYCWTEGAAYSLAMRKGDGTRAPVVDSFAELYRLNFGGDTYRLDSGKRAGHPDGSRFIDQPCASQDQADWLTAVSKRTWTRGRMSGHATSVIGFPANMQPALAVAATSGIPDAARAWEVFEGRADKPDYRKGPQWAIVPRTIAPPAASTRGVRKD